VLRKGPATLPLSATVPTSLRNTWIALLLAGFAVIVSGTFIVRSFYLYAFAECHGELQRVPTAELNEQRTSALRRVPSDEFELRYDTVKSKRRYAPSTYKNVRIVWVHADSTCSCSDAPVPWNGGSSTSPPSLTIERDEGTGLYVARGGAEDIAFRKVDGMGRRFQSDRLLDRHNVSMLVFLVSLVALGVAAARTLRATPYATRMHAWHRATLRHDGLVESETGATLGRMDPRSRVPAGVIIVDPAALEGRDIYRELPILTRRHVGAGSHERWYTGTMRRLRDARSLAILSTMTTAVALVARVLTS